MLNQGNYRAFCSQREKTSSNTRSFPRRVLPFYFFFFFCNFQLFLYFTFFFFFTYSLWWIARSFVLSLFSSYLRITRSLGSTWIKTRRTHGAITWVCGERKCTFNTTTVTQMLLQVNSRRFIIQYTSLVYIDSRYTHALSGIKISRCGAYKFFIKIHSLVVVATYLCHRISWGFTF